MLPAQNGKRKMTMIIFNFIAYIFFGGVVVRLMATLLTRGENSKFCVSRANETNGERRQMIYLMICV